jgi:hypothetical protein
MIRSRTILSPKQKEQRDRVLRNQRRSKSWWKTLPRDHQVFKRWIEFYVSGSSFERLNPEE